jgi:hypothetical protein
MNFDTTDNGRHRFCTPASDSVVHDDSKPGAVRKHCA